MFIQGTKNSVVFQKRRDVAGCGGDGKGDVDRIAKNTCIAEIMSRCQSRSIRHGESGHDGMTVRKRDAPFADSGHLRRAMWIDHSTTKAICNEQHEIIAAPSLRSNAGGGPSKH